MCPRRSSKKPPEEEILVLETHLQQSFKPVMPNQAFIDHLRTRLETPSVTTVEYPGRVLDIILTVSLILLIISVSLLLGLRLQRRLFHS
jgi:hypothetical protein